MDSINGKAMVAAWSRAVAAIVLEAQICPRSATRSEPQLAMTATINHHALILDRSIAQHHHARHGRQTAADPMPKMAFPAPSNPSTSRFSQQIRQLEARTTEPRATRL